MKDWETQKGIWPSGPDRSLEVTAAAVASIAAREGKREERRKSSSSSVGVLREARTSCLRRSNHVGVRVMAECTVWAKGCNVLFNREDRGERERDGPPCLNSNTTHRRRSRSRHHRCPPTHQRTRDTPHTSENSHTHPNRSKIHPASHIPRCPTPLSRSLSLSRPSTRAATLFAPSHRCIAHSPIQTTPYPPPPNGPGSHSFAPPSISLLAGPHFAPPSRPSRPTPPRTCNSSRLTQHPHHRILLSPHVHQIHPNPLHPHPPRRRRQSRPAAQQQHFLALLLPPPPPLPPPRQRGELITTLKTRSVAHTTSSTCPRLLPTISPPITTTTTTTNKN